MRRGPELGKVAVEGGGFSATFLASTHIQEDEISDESSLDRQMGQGGHVRHLNLVVGAMIRSWWAPDGC